ncbi:MAG: YybH family protein [Longimicrobiales bacterium]
MMRARPAAILLPFFLAACAPPPPAAPTFTAADVAAIDSVVAAAMAIATGSHDWDSYVQTYYAADATVMPANQGAVQGHAALVEFFRSYPTLTVFTPTKVEVQGVGDLAYVYGKYHLEMETPDGPAVDDGKYLEIWKRQADGGWKVAYDIFNTDQPLVAEGA